MSAVAVGGAVLSFILHKSALGLLKRQPELAVEVGRRLVQDRHMLLGRLAYFAYGGVRERLARGLLELGKYYGVRYEQGLLIDLPLSRQDLAELLGCSRQRASEELHKPVGMRLIQLRQGTIILTDMEGLRRLR